MAFVVSKHSVCISYERTGFLCMFYFLLESHLASAIPRKPASDEELILQSTLFSLCTNYYDSLIAKLSFSGFSYPTRSINTNKKFKYSINTFLNNRHKSVDYFNQIKST